MPSLAKLAAPVKHARIALLVSGALASFAPFSAAEDGRIVVVSVLEPRQAIGGPPIVVNQRHVIAEVITNPSTTIINRTHTEGMVSVTGLINSVTGAAGAAINQAQSAPGAINPGDTLPGSFLPGSGIAVPVGATGTTVTTLTPGADLSGAVAPGVITGMTRPTPAAGASALQAAGTIRRILSGSTVSGDTTGSGVAALVPRNPLANLSNQVNGSMGDAASGVRGLESVTGQGLSGMQSATDELLSSARQVPIPRPGANVLGSMAALRIDTAIQGNVTGLLTQSASASTGTRSVPVVDTSAVTRVTSGIGPQINSQLGSVLGGLSARIGGAR
jgi:hypothetical protein